MVALRYLNEFIHSALDDHVHCHCHYLSLFVCLFCGFVCLFVFPYTALHSTDTALPILVAGSLFEHEIMFFLMSTQQLLPWQHEDQFKTISGKVFCLD